MVSKSPNPGDKIREYEILETIGKGGMATVYKARHTLIDQTVAIKIMKPSLMDDQQFCERFIREAQAQAKLTGHPNIITIHNLFEEDNLYIIVMEYVDGMFVDGVRIRTLAQYIDHYGPLNVGRFKPILEGILEGLRFAHEHDVVHRDIKPANIMLTENGTTKIVDFGIARIIADQRLTKTGIAIGTPKYMSPEQVRSNENDARSDIYSLGITMYEALTGKVPFTGDTDYEIMRQHEETSPPPPRTINPGIPQEWEDLILVCIAKDPRQRPQHVRDIKDMLTGEKKPCPPRIIQKKEKRRRPLSVSQRVRFAGIVAILALLCIIFYAAIYRPGHTPPPPMLSKDSVTLNVEPHDIIVDKYIHLGRIITGSSYVITAYIMCNEDNLNEIIVQLTDDDPNLVYVHFTDNEHNVVASTNTNVIGAEYRSDFLSAGENTVRTRNGFYEGAFTINAEDNVLGALYFSARNQADEKERSPQELEIAALNSLGSLIAHFPDVKDALIQQNRVTLSEIIGQVRREVPNIEYMHIVDQQHRFVASSDTQLIGSVLSNELIHRDLQEADANIYNEEFTISVSNIQVGTLMLGASLLH